MSERVPKTQKFCTMSHDKLQVSPLTSWLKSILLQVYGYLHSFFTKESASPSDLRRMEDFVRKELRALVAIDAKVRSMIGKRTCLHVLVYGFKYIHTFRANMHSYLTKLSFTIREANHIHPWTLSFQHTHIHTYKYTHKHTHTYISK